MQTHILGLCIKTGKEKVGHFGGAFKPRWERKWVSFLKLHSLEPAFAFFCQEADRQRSPRNYIEANFM